MIKFSDKITQAVFKEMVKVALAEQTCSYQHIGSLVGIPHEHDSLGRYMGEISEWFYERHGVLPTVLIVRSDTGKPGDGFPHLAWELKHPDVHNPNFYSDETKRTWKLFTKLRKRGQV